jgi:hypothetical protein
MEQSNNNDDSVTHSDSGVFSSLMWLCLSYHIKICLIAAEWILELCCWLLADHSPVPLLSSPFSFFQDLGQANLYFVSSNVK